MLPSQAFLQMGAVVPEMLLVLQGQFFDSFEDCCFAARFPHGFG